MSKAKKAMPMAAPAGMGDGGKPPKKKEAEGSNPHPPFKGHTPPNFDVHGNPLNGHTWSAAHDAYEAQLSPAKQSQKEQEMRTNADHDAYEAQLSPAKQSQKKQVIKAKIKKSLSPGMSYKRLKEIESEEDGE